MSEEKKQRLKEYQKSYYNTKMSQHNNKSNNFLIAIDKLTYKNELLLV